MPGGFTHLVKMLDEVPVVTACLGPAVGLGAAKAVASHFCVMPKNGSLFAAGPPVVIPATRGCSRKRSVQQLVVFGLTSFFEIPQTKTSRKPNSAVPLFTAPTEPSTTCEIFPSSRSLPFVQDLISPINLPS